MTLEKKPKLTYSAADAAQCYVNIIRGIFGFFPASSPNIALDVDNNFLLNINKLSAAKPVLILYNA